MLNTINLHESQKFYEVSLNGKTYQCARITDVLESTRQTPQSLRRWMVNCAANKLFGLDQTGLDIAQFKEIAWNAHQEEMQAALDIGSEVHALITLPSEPSAFARPESEAAYFAYKQFCKKHKITMVASELKVYDTKMGIAGTIDWIGIVDGELYILDWKTSKAIQDGYKIQVSVYKDMLTKFLKVFKKEPSAYTPETQRVCLNIFDAGGKNPRFNTAIVRLDKSLAVRRATKGRKFFEFCKITATEEKAYLKEFKLALKLYQLRKGSKNGNDSHTK